MSAKTQIVKVKRDQLIKASWNYKTDGTEEQIQHLARAILKAGSCGVLAVREVSMEGKPMFEVMDGNHRLEALGVINWDDVMVENFGPISQAEAIILTRQRNENWFEDDKLKLANLFTDHVFGEYDKEELAGFLPETIEQLDIYEEMSNMEWIEPEEKAPTPSNETQGYEKKLIKIQVEEETQVLWEKWLERALNVAGVNNHARAFEFALIQAMNFPEEALMSEMKQEDDL